MLGHDITLPHARTLLIYTVVFAGEASIASLKEKLVERGKKFVHHCLAENGKQMFKYTGDAHFHTGRSLLHRVDSSVGEGIRQADDSSSLSRFNDENFRNEMRSVSKKRVCVLTSLLRYGD